MTTIKWKTGFDQYNQTNRKHEQLTVIWYLAIRTCNGRGGCVVGGGVFMAGGGGHMHGREHACRRDGHCSGRYASYWNAFLSCIISELLAIHFGFKLIDFKTS